LCVFCDHFGWNEFEYYRYSTMTDGTSGGLSCVKGQMNAIHYNDPQRAEKSIYRDAEINPDDTEDFRKIIRIAERCPDYSPPKSGEPTNGR
jgi:hypothetical protein